MIRPWVVVPLFALSACASLTSGRGGYGQTYYPASHNWTFRRLHPRADRLFNAFDYGHAILYEKLLESSGRDRLDTKVFDHVVSRVLRHPPAVPLDEHAIGPDYATFIPEVVAVFEWAHMLHRQLYDVLSDTRIAPHERADRVARVLAYYESRPDLALSERPKSMTLMEGQPYSLTFRRAAPRCNGLIWSYHWLQMVVYEALLASDARESRTQDIDAAIAHFWEMIEISPVLPSVMPMSAAIAPTFTARYPEAAAIFDNLHALHDVISDILASEHLSRAAKRSAALTASAHYRDSTTAIMERDAWTEMSRAMGVDQMGGLLRRASLSH